jgi:hypothetical protein
MTLREAECTNLPHDEVRGAQATSLEARTGASWSILRGSSLAPQDEVFEARSLIVMAGLVPAIPIGKVVPS